MHATQEFVEETNLDIVNKNDNNNNNNDNNSKIANGGDIDETTNRIISECSKLARKKKE